MSLLLLWMGTLQRKGCHSFSTAQGCPREPESLESCCCLPTNQPSLFLLFAVSTLRMSPEPTATSTPLKPGWVSL